MKGIERLFGRLLALQFGVNDDDQPAPVDIPLSAKGKAAWIKFYNEHGKAQSETEGALAAAFSKLEGYSGRLALLVHMVRCAADDPSAAPEAVDPASVESGGVMARWFCHEAERVYAVMDESNEDRKTRRLAEWVQSVGGTATVRDAQRGRKYKTAADAEKALADLVKAGLGQWKTDSHDGGKGRPVSRFVLRGTSDSDTNSLKTEANDNCVTVTTVTDASDGMEETRI